MRGSLQYRFASRGGNMGLREYFKVLLNSERGCLAVRELLHDAFLALLECVHDDETYRNASHQNGVYDLVSFIHVTACERVESEKSTLTKGWNTLAFAPNVSPYDAFAHAEIQYMMYCLAAEHAYDSNELMQKVVDLLSEVSPYLECAFQLSVTGVKRGLSPAALIQKYHQWKVHQSVLEKADSRKKEKAPPPASTPKAKPKGAKGGGGGGGASFCWSAGVHVLS
jgi:hypothetical protein